MTRSLSSTSDGAIFSTMIAWRSLPRPNKHRPLEGARSGEYSAPKGAFLIKHLATTSLLTDEVEGFRRALDAVESALIRRLIRHLDRLQDKLGTSPAFRAPTAIDRDPDGEDLGLRAEPRRPLCGQHEGCFTDATTRIGTLPLLLAHND